MSDETNFIGRVDRGDGNPRQVRISTDGRAPEPEDEVFEIVDPFADPRGPFAGAHEGGTSLGPLSRLRLLPPLEPSKVLGIGRNYREHARELGNDVPETPLVFLKPPSCLLASGEPIVLPRGYERIDMEAELVVVIGRRARNVARADAFDHVAGYCLGNDVSCRDLQKRDGQWARAKGFDGFGPIGPFVRLCEPGFPFPATQVRLHGFLDDLPRQDATCDLMIFSIPELIETISACMTLEPGDIIFTGTPAGVAPLAPGQVVRIESNGFALGRLTNPIV